MVISWYIVVCDVFTNRHCIIKQIMSTLNIIYLQCEIVTVSIVTVNKGKYIMVVMQLSVSIDCPFLIATFSSVYINLFYVIKNVHIYVNNCFISTHILLKSPVFAVI